jgi:hypothetical protein
LEPSAEGRDQNKIVDRHPILEDDLAALSNQDLKPSAQQEIARGDLDARRNGSERIGAVDIRHVRVSGAHRLAR